MIDPVLADLQAEYEDAVRRGRTWQSRWTWVRGQAAFFAAIVCYGGGQTMRMLKDLRADDRCALVRTGAWCVAIIIAGTLVLAAVPFLSFVEAGRPDAVKLAIYLVPQALPLSIPLGLTLGVIWGMGRSGVSLRSRVAVLLAAAALSAASFAILGWLAPSMNQAFRVAIVGTDVPKGAHELTLGELRRLLRPARNEWTWPPPAALAAFGAALPEWAERFPGAASPAPAPLGLALAETLRAATDEQPVTLAVDDAQWLDVDSALALGVALRDLGAAPLTLVLATSSYPARPDLDELRTRIGRDFEGGAVRLRALDRTSLRALAQRMLPGYDPIALDRVVRRVATDSAGMPLLAVELLRAVALGLDLGTISGAWPEPLRTLDQSLPGDLPDAVVAAIRVAYRRLSPTAQRVLVAAAVLGDLTTPQRIERALSLAPREIDRALDELEWQRWLLAEPRGYTFVARIVRQVVERDLLTTGQRRRILEAAR